MPVFAPGTSILTPMPLTVHRFEQTMWSSTPAEIGTLRVPPFSRRPRRIRVGRAASQARQTSTS